MYYFIWWKSDADKIHIKKISSLEYALAESKRVIYSGINWYIVSYNNGSPFIVERSKNTRERDEDFFHETFNGFVYTIAVSLIIIIFVIISLIYFLR